MSKRHEAIGIKQVVRLEWYDYALDMLTAVQKLVHFFCEQGRVLKNRKVIIQNPAPSFTVQFEITSRFILNHQQICPQGQPFMMRILYTFLMA